MRDPNRLTQNFVSVLCLFFYCNFIARCQSLDSSKFKGSSRKNVLLVVADDFRPQLPNYDCLQCREMVTPNLRQFASLATTFSNAFANQAMCGPSRTSFLTGRRPDATKLYDQGSHYWRTFPAAGNFTTIPQYFKERGYRTASFGKIFHPGRASGHTDDFPYSWTHPPFHPPSQKFKNFPSCPGVDIVGQNPLLRDYANVVCGVNPEREPLGTLPDVETVEAALEYLSQIKKADESLDRNLFHDYQIKPASEDGNSSSIASGRKHNQPLFLAVGFHKPHIPLKFPLDYDSLYPVETIRLPYLKDRTKPSGLPEVAWNPWNDIRRRDDVAASRPAFPFGPLLPDEFQKKIRQSYFAAISYVDDLFGKLLAGVKEQFPEFFENCVVIFTSDHGWSLGEHGEWSKYSNYETATRVPLMVHDSEIWASRDDWRKKKSSLAQFVHQNPFDVRTRGFGQRNDRDAFKISDEVVELVDLFPTLTELALKENLPTCPSSSKARLIPACAEGASFARALSSSSSFQSSSPPTEKSVISQFPRPGLKPTVSPDSDQPRLSEMKVMGYSVRWLQFRYAEWVEFDHHSLKANFSAVFARELYDLGSDALENDNISGSVIYFAIEKYLSWLLRNKVTT